MLLVLSAVLCITALAVQTWAADVDPASIQDPYYRSLIEETSALEPMRLLLGGTTDETLRHFTFGTMGGSARCAEVPVQGAGFAHADQITTEKKTEEWRTLIQWWVPEAALRRGEVVYVTASVRFLSAQDGRGQGQGRLYASRQCSGSNDAGDLLYAGDFPILTGWHRVHMPLTVVHDFGPGDRLKIMFTFGQCNQSIEIGGIAALVFPIGTPLERLPHQALDLDYPGRSLDAPWRKAALERIDKIRKGDLTVQVVDQSGHPVAGADVTVRQTRHAFKFGTNAPFLLVPGSQVKPWNDDFSRVLNASPALRAEALKAFTAHFNAGTSGLTWAIWEGADARISRQDCMALAAWMHAVGMPIDHVQVVYPGAEFLSPAARPWYDRQHATQFAAAIKAHIMEQCQALAPYGLASFEIANELAGRPGYTDILGRHAVLDWFRWADEARRAFNPGMRLMTNFPCSVAMDGPPHRAEAEFKDWLEQGAPPTGDWNYEFAEWLKQNTAIDYLGFQNHAGIGWAGPEAVLRGLDWYATIGLPIEITEFEVTLQDGKDPVQRAYQEDYVRDFYTAVFSHPATQGITTQDYWQLNAWQQDGASCFWDKDMEIQPHGRVYLDLVEHQWWTTAHGTTGVDGRYATRGFFGDYTIIVTRNGRTTDHTTTLGSAGRRLRLVVP